jgi:hypothetical protein
MLFVSEVMRASPIGEKNGDVVAGEASLLGFLNDTGDLLLWLCDAKNRFAPEITSMEGA